MEKNRLIIIISTVFLLSQAVLSKEITPSDEVFFLKFNECNTMGTPKNLEEPTDSFPTAGVAMVCFKKTGIVTCLDEIANSETFYMLKSDKTEKKVWSDKQTTFFLNLEKNLAIKTDLVDKEKAVVMQLCKGFGFNKEQLLNFKKYDISIGLLNIIDELDKKEVLNEK